MQNCLMFGKDKERPLTIYPTIGTGCALTFTTDFCRSAVPLFQDEIKELVAILNHWLETAELTDKIKNKTQA